MGIADLRQRIIEDVSRDFSRFQTCFFVTLNELTNDYYKLYKQVDDLMHWLNCYCYGDNYKKNGKRLRIVGIDENGSINQGLHMHLFIGHKNDTNRTNEEIIKFIYRKWYVFVYTKTKSLRRKTGSLVDVQPTYNLSGCLWYLTKNIYRQSTNLNPRYF